MSDEQIEARKKKAERGWLVDPPPPPPREYIPGEEHKWRLMMGSPISCGQEDDDDD